MPVKIFSLVMAPSVAKTSPRTLTDRRRPPCRRAPAIRLECAAGAWKPGRVSNGSSASPEAGVARGFACPRLSTKVPSGQCVVGASGERRVTKDRILERFGAETDFFSTFGGNPVGCAAGNAVLDVIEREGLMESARLTGDYLRRSLSALMGRHGWIGDVRGRGLLVGVELVRDRRSLEPAEAETRRVVNHMRENAVLVGREGPHGNVLKIRPPLAFRREQTDILVEALDAALAAL